MKKLLIAVLIMTTGFCCWCALAPSTSLPKRMLATMLHDSIPDIRYERDTTLTATRYTKLQQRITADRLKLVEQSKDSVRRYFLETLYEKMVPYWIGTPWDFNGYTAVPGEGQVACGYLVSTTLKHMGVNVNRYKLAQQYSHGIVRSLCQHDSVFTNKEKMLTYLKSRPDDAWVVGLDNHVGYLFTFGKEVRFVHSSFVSPGCVIDEGAESSLVLNSSEIYVVGSLMHNNNLMKKWLEGQVVVIRE